MRRAGRRPVPVRPGDRKGYTVRVDEGDGGWTVEILDPDGGVASRRACATESEAATYASTVRQHIRWLSPERFRLYYRLDRDEGRAMDERPR